MKPAQTSVVWLLAVTVVFASALVHAETLPEKFDKLQECIDVLKTKGGNRAGVIRDCSDSSKDPLWVGAPAYMCIFDWVEGDLRGEDPAQQYHERVHHAEHWLCERVTGKDNSKSYVLYQSGEFEWVYDVATGYRVYGGKKTERRALWLKSETQNFYVYCPAKDEVFQEHSNRTWGGSVRWTIPSKPVGPKEWFEPQVYFPQRHKKNSSAFFDGKGGSRPCNQARDYAGKGVITLQNPPHNQQGSELPSADDNMVDLNPEWKAPPRVSQPAPKP